MERALDGALAVRTVQDITLGVAAQTLFYDATEGRPSSVTSVEVQRWDSSDDADPEAATTGAAAVETNPNTVTDAAAGASQANPRKVPVAATTGVAADRTFLLSDPDGHKELVVVRDFDAADAVYARHPLHNDYAIGSTFVSTRMSIVVDTTWCSDDGNIDDSSGPNPMYRVRWVYVVAGVTYVADTYFNLVRYAGKHGVTPADVDNFCPGWLNRLPTDHKVDQGRRLIDEAFRGVKLDLAGVDVDEAAIAESELVDELVRYKTVELTEFQKFITGPSSTDATRWKAAEGRYVARLNAFVRLVPRAPIRGTTGAAGAGQKIGLTRR